MFSPGFSDQSFPDGAGQFPDAISRRRFLTLLSASASLAFGASCSRTDRGTIVPYTKRPGETIPGVARYYASTFQEGLITHGVLVKTREGRPIHIEGNPEYVLNGGKTSMRSIGDLLRLYDPDRLRHPTFKGMPSTWEEAYDEMGRVLREVRIMDRPILLLTEAVVSPTRRALIQDLKFVFPKLRHAAWEPCVSHAEISAATALYGEAIIPRLHFDRASVILSLHSDFLGAEGNSPAAIRDFSARRGISAPADANNKMNRLWVIEGAMTLTGANADKRLQVRPSEIASLAFAMVGLLNEVHRVPLPPALTAEDLKPLQYESLARDLKIDSSLLASLASDLARAGESALVVAGSALPPQAHVACRLLNSMLGAEGQTVDSTLVPSSPELLTFSGFRELLAEAARGTFSAGIFWDTNPAYDFPDASVWKSAVAKIPSTFRIGPYEDETALDCVWRLPEHHWLESWGDFEPGGGFLSLRQPAIGAIHDTRQGEDILLSCMRALKVEAPGTYLEYLRARWQAEVYPRGIPVPFETFWNAALGNGLLKQEAKPFPSRVPDSGAIKSALRVAAPAKSRGVPDELELVLAPGTAVHDGRYANNGWLNELPDPVTKVTWGNPLLVSVSDAERLGLRDEDMVRVSVDGRNLDAPVLVQPGQAPGVVSLALGYGRRTGGVAAGIGVNAYPMIDISSDTPLLRSGVKISRIAGTRAIPRTQAYGRIQNGEQARSWTVGEYAAEVEAGQVKGPTLEERQTASLIPDQKFVEHKWGMVIDLSACVGCSACVIACQSENNIPVVGPERVLVRREMHWIRVDRYYRGETADPSTVHQPVLCQQCDNAPCEVVCPVNATTHSPDGLNQMTYNRCVGTRYCSNNCPFKVRRFNFFDYTSTKKAPEDLIYNPEVTVRPRGVMEKCTFCIQRIQNARQMAKVEGRSIRDGEIEPACAVACPAGAIVFGDMNNPESRVVNLSKSNRSYRMLEELGIKPSVTYLVNISNAIVEKSRS